MTDEQDRAAVAEKLGTQAETGGGRTMARPAATSPGGHGGVAGSGMAGSETNDAMRSVMPGSGAAEGQVMPGMVAPETSP